MPSLMEICIQPCYMLFFSPPIFTFFFRVFSTVIRKTISYFFFLQGYKAGVGNYYQGLREPGPGGRPQDGFVRREWDGVAVYFIEEYVDGKLHGHRVWYGPAGNVLLEEDWLRGVLQ